MNGEREPMTEEQLQGVEKRCASIYMLDGRPEPADQAGMLAVMDAPDLVAEVRRLQEERADWQRATGCIDPYTIELALARIGAMLDRLPTEGIPDAIERLKRERDRVRAEEREACAKIADDEAMVPYDDRGPVQTSREIAAKIRARGSKT